MIWVGVAAAVVILALLERFWMPAALSSLRFRGGCDRIMAQPGEQIQWTSTVENHSKLPIPFVRLIVSCPEGIRLEASEKWIRTHYRRGVYLWFVEERMSLKPLQSITRTMTFSLPRRGVYEIGEYRMSAGDLLGLREGTRLGAGKRMVIIPERSRNFKTLQALGGVLGDVSVKRFILEDPILTVGFRDYTGREPMKSVSWTRTAVAGKLQVKQYDYTAEHIVTVLLNVEGANAQSLEECFRLTRSVCEELEKRKLPYAFHTNGNLPSPTGNLFFLPEGLGGQHLDTILYGLGQANSTCFFSFSTLVRQVQRKRRLNEAYILVSPELDADAAAALGRLEAGAGSSVCVLYGKEGSA